MQQFFKNWKINKKYKETAAVLAAVLLIVGAVGFAAARYVSNNQKEAEIHASNFHFSSNYLSDDETAAQFDVSDWGSHDVAFYLFNYEQENIALVSDSDIIYKISAPEDWSVQVQDATGNVLEPNGNGEYTMEKSMVKTFHCVTLRYSGTGTPGSAKVTVESTVPYKKTLQAIFNLTTKKGLEYKIEDKGDYKLITISTNDYYGTVTVTWDPAYHSPDNTCDYMGSWRNENPTGTLTVTEYTTYTLIFVENQAGAGTEDLMIAGV